MSGAAERLARTRQAIIEQIQHREQRHPRGDSNHRREAEAAGAHAQQGEAGDWFERIREAAANWWRYHPAHLGLELATPALSEYAAKKPLQFLGIAAALGAAVVIARPWRLISITGLLMAVAKSSQLSNVLLSALAAANHRKGHEPQQ